MNILTLSNSVLSDGVMLASDGGGIDPLHVSADLALWTLIIFGGLLFLLGKFAWKPIIEGLNAREQGIADKIDSADKAEQQAQSNLQQYESKLASAHDEAAAVMAEAKTDANVAKEKIIAEANEEATRTRQRALADVEAAKSAAVRELAESSVNTAVGLASSIVGRSLTVDDHAKLIADSVERFSSPDA